MRNRAELEKRLIHDIRNQVKPKRAIAEKIKNNLLKYKILSGSVQSIIDETENLNSIDNRVLFLLAEQVHFITGNEFLLFSQDKQPYFTEEEKKQAHSYEGDLPTELELPLTIENVEKVNDTFRCNIDAKFLRYMWDSQLIYYNFDTQREARYVQIGEDAEPRPSINQSSVIEVANDMETGKLFSTALTFNLRPGTGENGEEFYYDENSKTLTILKGTMIDIIDGMHRLAGSNRCLRKADNKDLKFDWEIRFVSYSLATARRFVAQIGKVNPIDPSKIKALEGNRYSDLVVKEIQRNSSFGKLISESTEFPIQKHIISFKELADAIEEEFYMQTRADMLDVSEYLVEFFDSLIAYYPEQLEHNQTRVKYHETNLLNHGFMIAALIYVAYRMRESGISARKIGKMLRTVNFSKDNKIWTTKGILTESLKYTPQHKKNTRKLFASIDFNTKEEVV